MAIYHLSTKPISRSSGRSAVASIAYRAGIEITDERVNKVHDYTKRSGVVETSLHMPIDFKGDKLEGIERSKIWNMAEQKETRSNSRTAREIVVNLPHELSKNERSQLVNNFANELADKYQIAVDVAIHTPDKEGDNRNHHAHLMLTTRRLEQLANGNLALMEKARLELSNTQLKDRGLPKAQDELKGLRKDWADRTNAVLERGGHEERIDHRSHKDRGLDIKPTVKEGWQATQLERMGIKTEVGNQNRQIRADNLEIIGLKAEIITKRKIIANNTAKNAPNRSIEPPKEKASSVRTPKVEKAQEERNNSHSDLKKEKAEILANINNFEKFVNDKTKQVHEDKLQTLKQIKSDCREQINPLVDEIKDMEKNEPKKPLIPTPSKIKNWKEKHDTWEKSYDSKVTKYRDMRKDFDQADKDEKMLKSKGVEGSKETAVSLLKQKRPEVFKDYIKAVDRVNEITQIEQRQSAQRAVDRMNEQKEQRSNKDMDR